MCWGGGEGRSRDEGSWGEEVGHGVQSRRLRGLRLGGLDAEGEPITHGGTPESQREAWEHRAGGMRCMVWGRGPGALRHRDSCRGSWRSRSLSHTRTKAPVLEGRKESASQEPGVADQMSTRGGRELSPLHLTFRVAF